MFVKLNLHYNYNHIKLPGEMLSDTPSSVVQFPWLYILCAALTRCFTQLAETLARRVHSEGPISKRNCIKWLKVISFKWCA